MFSIQKTFILTLFLPLFLSLNYTIYNNIDNSLLIPSSEFKNEEPFAATMSTYKYSSNSYSYIDSFCNFNPLNIELRELVRFDKYNSTIENPEFLNIDDYIYFFDKDGKLKIFQLFATPGEGEDDDFVLKKVNDDLSIKIDVFPNSTINMFGDSTAKKIYLFVDKTTFILNLSSNYASPTVEKIELFEEANFSNISTLIFDGSSCFFYLIDTIKLNMACIETSNGESKIVITQDVINNFLPKSLKSFSFQDMCIDQGILYLAEGSGIYIFDIIDVKKIKLIHQSAYTNVVSIRKYMQSLFLITEFTTGTVFENYFEEYYIYVNQAIQNNVTLILNRRITLGFSRPEIHLVRNYILLLQNNIIQLYRHSIDPSFNEKLHDLLFKDVLKVHRLATTKYNIFIGIFPDRMALFSIDTSAIKLMCYPRVDTTPSGLYLFNFTVYSTTCDQKIKNILNYTRFVACQYTFGAEVSVYDTMKSKGGDGGSDKGLIAGLTVGLFFFFVVVIGLFCWLYRMSKRYDKLEESTKRPVNLPMPVLGAERESNEEGHFESPEVKNQIYDNRN